MIGYHANADLALIEQQLLDEFQNAGACEQNHCMQCKAANNLTDREILLSKIKSATLYARSGLILEAFREIDAVSRYSFCDASFLHLVAGDLGRAAGCHFEACNAYKRVKWLHPVYYSEAVSRKGRTYTAELKRWRELGLKPVTVAMYGGEGGEKYLLELVADRLYHSAVSSPADAKSQLAGLSGVECLYLEMVIDTLPGEEFEEEQWPVYGYSVVSSMGPYITTKQRAAETALTFVNHWFYDLQRQNPDWRNEIISDYTWSQLSRMMRIPREYATSNFKANEDIVHDMICGRRLRYSTGRQGRDWLDWMGSIEPKGCDNNIESLSTLALDLEGTLISHASSMIPRSGLYQFMEFCQEVFTHIVFFSFVEEERGRQILQQLVDAGYMPDWVVNAEYVTAIGGKPGAKDLRLLGVDPENALLVDDQPHVVPLDQRARLIQIAEFKSPYADDRELERVRQILEAFLAEKEQ